MRVVTILGPSHSGKTTLVDAMVGLEGAAGAHMDVAGVASVRNFKYMGDGWAAIDIAGGAENLSQAGAALAASDAAVLCVPADADAAVLSAPHLRLLEAAGIPSIIFVNRVDAAANRISEIVSALQDYCGHNIVLRQVPMRSAEQIVGAVDLISERAWEYHEGKPSTLIEIPDNVIGREQAARTELLESLADFDDTLLEQLIEDKQPMASEIYDVAIKVLQQHDLVPALLGSALHRNGIVRLMKSLRHEAPSFDVARDRLRASDISAVGCVADSVKHLGKTIVVRAFDGSLNNGGILGGNAIGSITEINAKTPVNALKPGEIGLTVKTDHLNLGYCYSKDKSADLPAWAQAHRPTYRRIIIPLHEKDETRLSSALDRLSEIDPGLLVEQDDQTGQAVMNAQGPQHLRRLLQTLADGFGIAVEESMVPAALRETIRRKVEWRHRHRKQSGGAGQFADVVIELKPEPRGSGFRFEDTVKGGAVPRNYIPSVEAGAKDALTKGPGGCQVVDVSVVLKDGKHHSVDSSDYAFKTAGKNAVSEALAEAGSVLLQPILRVEIHVPTIFAGGLVPIVSGMKGQVLGFENHPSAAGWDVFSALLPMAAQDELFNSLASATRGTAWFTTEFDHYQEARREDLASVPA